MKKFMLCLVSMFCLGCSDHYVPYINVDSNIEHAYFFETHMPIKVDANVKYDVYIENISTRWITYKGDSIVQVSPSEFDVYEVFEMKPNTSPIQRIGKIMFVAGGIKEEVSILQLSNNN